MSTKCGPSNRKRPQKHQNTKAWEFDKNKSDPTTKLLQNFQVSNCCKRCTETIEWKIKYGKYKPLSKPGTCTKCKEKRVKFAYHILCNDCVENSGKCAKCGLIEQLSESTDNISSLSAAELKEEFKVEIKLLPERKRRTFLRYLQKVEKTASKNSSSLGTELNEEDKVEVKSIQDIKAEVIEKLNKLKESIKDFDDDDDDFDF